MARMARRILDSMDADGKYKVTQPADVHVVRLGDRFVHVACPAKCAAPSACASRTSCAAARSCDGQYRALTVISRRRSLRRAVMSLQQPHHIPYAGI
jgi:hypothetical protein